MVHIIKRICYNHNALSSIGGHSNFSNNTSNNNGNASNLLPTIKYHQYSNFSNNSNSTQISSATAHSNASAHSGVSDPHYNISLYPTDGQQQPPPQATAYYQQIPPHLNPHAISGGQGLIPTAMAPQPQPTHHTHLSTSAMTTTTMTLTMTDPSHHQQMIPRSSTGNINLLDLDIEIDEEEKKLSIQDADASVHSTHSVHSIPSMHSIHSIHSDINTTKKHERRTTRSLELKSFNDDIRAYNTWISCLNQNENDTIYFYNLYPKLCEYFMDIVHSTRYPTTNDLRPIFIKHGAQITGNNSQYLTISKLNFIQFWSWYKECCEIIKELRYLWDPNGDKYSNSPSSSKSSSPSAVKRQNSDSKSKTDKTRGKKDKNVIEGLGLNFFCQRQVCEENLLQSIDGTFGLRLSSSIIGGVVLSYVENNYNDINNKRGCKHVILIRQQNQQNMYSCNKKILSLHDIIRNFVKLKFLYTPNRPIPKEKIF